MNVELDDPELVARFRRGRGPTDLETRYRAHRAGRLTNLLRIFAPVVLIFNIIQFTHALAAPWSPDFTARLAFILFLVVIIALAFLKYREGSYALVLTTLYVFLSFACFLQFMIIRNPSPEPERSFPYLLLAATGVYFFAAGGWRVYAPLLLIPTTILGAAVALFANVPPEFWTTRSNAAGSFTVLLIAIVVREFMERSRRSEFLALEMSTANARLRALDKLKDDFLARTSHELRAPLQGIIGIAEAMSGRTETADDRDKENPEEPDDPTLIARSGRRLAGLIDDLLDYTRLKHRDVRLDLRPVDLRGMARVVLDLNRFTAARNNKELRNEIPATFAPVLADENRLQQILQNLIDNAVKYADPGVIRVQARGWKQNQAMISVSDQGPGIPRETRESIFHSFEEGLDLAGDYPGPGPGTGLGLSISRRLVNLHGGHMGVRDEPDGGSRFYFTLPFASSIPATEISDSSPPADINPSTPANRPAAFASPGPETAVAKAVNMNGDAANANAKRILVVDDEAVNQRVIRGYLENHGYAVLTARTGVEALEILNLESGGETPVQAVILDLMMPGLNGFDTARKIREHRGRLELPILITSARARRRDLFAALNAGANDYIPKPVEPGALLLRLDSLLLLAEQHLAGISFEREHEESLRRERQRLLTDLHDHLGAQLTDVRIAAEALIKRGDFERESTHALRAHIKRAGEMLREEMQLIDDLDLLDENFLAGTQLMLLRRYSSAERELDFHAPLEIESIVHEGLGTNGRSVLHAVVRETATNDLKYGYGPSRWQVSLDEGRLLLEVSAATNYSPDKHGTGRGTEHLIRRVTELGGSVNIDSPEENPDEGDWIRIRVMVPLRKIPVGGDAKKA